MEVNRLQKPSRREWMPLAAMWAVLGLSYVALALFLQHWHYDLLRADGRGYWYRSNGVISLYDAYHVPGYPWLIWAARQIFGDAHPLRLMMGINVLFLLGGAGAAYGLVRQEGGSSWAAVFAGWLYGLWPVTGLVFSVNPWADVPATASFLLGWLAWRARRRGWAVLGMAAALLMHKALWGVVGLWWVSVWWHDAAFPRRGKARDAALAFLPLAALWLVGVVGLHAPWNWLLAHNLEAELRPLALPLPVFSGVVETLLEGGARGLLRGGLLVSGLLLAVFLAVWAWRRRRWEMLAVVLGVLALFAAVNAYEALAAWRFSRLLAVPLTVFWADCRRCWRRGLVWLVVGAAWASQFAFAWWSVCRWQHGGWCGG